MMSESSYVFYNWFLFVWGAAGFLFIAVVAIKEVFELLKNSKQAPEKVKLSDDKSL